MKRTFMLFAGLLLSATAFAAPTYFIQADIVRGAVGAQGAACVANAVFFPGEQIVWRTYVFDAASGERLTQKQIDAAGLTVSGTLEGDVKTKLNYIPHPPGDAPNKDVFWAGGWVIPKDFSTGTYTWSVGVEDKNGNHATFEPIGQSVGLGNLTIAQPETSSASSAQNSETGGAETGGAETGSKVDGEQLYVQNCSACHQQNGAGILGTFPPLADNPLVTGNPNYLARIVLYGLEGKVTVAGQNYNGQMPAWKSSLDDAEIAAVLTYVRSSFGNDAAAVTSDLVADERSKPGSPQEVYQNYPAEKE